MGDVRIDLDRVLLKPLDVSHPGNAGEVAGCLAKAFSSGIWKTSPMPVGPPTDGNSALGILRELGQFPAVLAAHAAPCDTIDCGPIIGCVLGAVMDESVIERYRLAPFDAKPGDGLLAFIGIAPEAQRIRLFVDNNDFAIVSRYPAERQSTSLARHLFETWLSMEKLSACEKIFIRTREMITPVLYLCEQNGFFFCGRFEMQYHKKKQERLVFCRTRSSLRSGSLHAAPALTRKV